MNKAVREPPPSHRHTSPLAASQPPVPSRVKEFGCLPGSGNVAAPAASPYLQRSPPAQAIGNESPSRLKLQGCIIMTFPREEEGPPSPPPPPLPHPAAFSCFPGSWGYGNPGAALEPSAHTWEREWVIPAPGPVGWRKEKWGGGALGGGPGAGSAASLGSVTRHSSGLREGCIPPWVCRLLPISEL